MISQPTEPSTMSIDETHVTAVLAGGMVRVRLPMVRPVDAGTLVAVSLVDAKDITVGFTSTQLPAGARQADASLALPKEKDAKEHEGLEWHRIRYRMESSGTVQCSGTLALGEVAQNLLRMHLALPSSRMEPGKPVKVPLDPLFFRPHLTIGHDLRPAD